MQNTTTAQTGTPGQPQWTPTLPSMYPSQTHQRNPSNPRSYAAGPSAESPVAPEPRREEQQLYPSTSNEGYSGYQPAPNAGYGAGVTGYGGYNAGMSMYNTNSSPTAPSSSRRTSNPKAGTTPPSATNPSPSARYYPGQPSTSADPSHMAQASYISSSAPPQVSTHAHHHSMTQPQTAHPYGGGYHSYYDQSQQGQYYQQQQQHQHAQQYHHQQGFQQPSSSRAPAQPQSATTPTMPQSSSDQHQHQHPRATTSPYDYQQATPTYSAGYAQQWPTPTSGRSSLSAQTAQQGQWQGYPNVPHQYPGQSSHYPMQWPGNYYPHPQLQPPAGAVPHISPPLAKKVKKDKSMKDEYAGLGKRPPDSTDEEDDQKKEKRGRKKKPEEEKEKALPKPPAKSHLHPPRQAQSAWQLFFTDELNKAKASAAAHGDSPGGTPHHAKLNVAQIAKDAGAAYANLNEEQKAYYAQKVQESKDQYAKELAAWQSTLTPEDIRAENAFRAQQRKEGKSRKGNLKDPNAPKKPLSAYFLFLKGIREDDALRARVWGGESETTKQSVLAAERWRALSDEEKRPFLQQAEKDKQDYEIARKVYEEDAAARARGEDVPTRLVHPEPSLYVPPMPASAMKQEYKPQAPVNTYNEEKPDHNFQSMANTSLTDAAPEAEAEPEPNFADYTRSSSEDKPTLMAGNTETSTNDANANFDQSIDLDDDFQGFADPLALDGMDMELSLSGMGPGQDQQQWGDLHDIMGGDGTPVDIPVPTAPSNDADADDDEDVDEAPSMAEAAKQTTGLGLPDQVIPPSEEREVAAVAEGELSVPSGLSDAPDAAVASGGNEPAEAEADSGSGVPTEEVNELPPADLPPMVDELPASTADQVDAVDDVKVDSMDGQAGLAVPAATVTATSTDTDAITSNDTEMTPGPDPAVQNVLSSETPSGPVETVQGADLYSPSAQDEPASTGHGLEASVAGAAEGSQHEDQAPNQESGLTTEGQAVDEGPMATTEVGAETAAPATATTQEEGVSDAKDEGAEDVEPQAELPTGETAAVDAV